MGGRGRSPPEAESFFVHFDTKKLSKVKDLTENLPPCLSRAAKASPKFWSLGGSAALTAHSWICHCDSTVELRRVGGVYWTLEVGPLKSS